MRSSNAWAPSLKCGLPSPKLATALAALGLILASCAAAPTVSLSPTEIAPQASPAAATVTTSIPEATEIAGNNDYTVSIADIFFLTPGDGSQVVSPIEVAARLQPGADGQVVAELSDQAGRILVRQVLALSTTEFATELPFEISRPPMPARLTLRTVDSYGRTQALNSVELMLLAEGQATIVPGNELTPITLSQPVDGQSIQAPEITISGSVHATSSRPLSIQLITREGRVLAAHEVYPRGETSPATFELVINARISEPTWVQVAVTQYGRTPGPAHFSAVEVLLLP